MTPRAKLKALAAAIAASVLSPSGRSPKVSLTAKDLRSLRLHAKLRLERIEGCGLACWAAERQAVPVAGWAGGRYERDRQEFAEALVGLVNACPDLAAVLANRPLVIGYVLKSGRRKVKVKALCTFDIRGENHHG